MNIVILSGNVGNDPEFRALDSGQEVANFSVATNKTYKKNGEKITKTEWHRCVAWGGRAGFVNNWIKKGTAVEITGELVYEQWEDRDGNKRTTAKINVSNIEFAKGGSAGDNQGGDSNNNRQANNQRKRQAQPANSGGGSWPTVDDEPGQYEDQEDDLPF